MTDDERALVVAMGHVVDKLAAIVVAMVPEAMNQRTAEANRATFQRLETELRRIIDGLEREP